MSCALPARREEACRFPAAGRDDVETAEGPAIDCSARADMPQLGGQQNRDPATRPRGAPPLGLLLGFLHDRVVIGRPVPARALVMQRARAARRLPCRLACRAPTGPERHQCPPQQQDLFLAHLGHRGPSHAVQAGTVGGISAASGGPLRLGPPYSERRLATPHEATGLWQNGRAWVMGLTLDSRPWTRHADGPWPRSGGPMPSARPGVPADLVPQAVTVSVLQRAASELAATPLIPIIRARTRQASPHPMADR